MTIIEHNQDKRGLYKLFSDVYSGAICSYYTYLSTGTQDGVAFPCPAGTLSRQMGLSNKSDCELCPPGRYCSSSGLAAPTGVCSAG